MGRKTNQSATVDTLPRERPQITQHNHAPSYAGLVFSGLLAVIVLAIFGYYAMVYLASRLDAQDPERFVAECLIGLVGGIIILAALLGFFKFIFADIKDYRLQMEDKRLDKLTIMHRLQSAMVNDTRTLDPTIIRRDKLITALVLDALEGDYNFSLRKAGAYILSDEDKPLGKDSRVVRETLEWLRQKEAINQKGVWLGRYQSLADLQRDLHTPIAIS